LKNNGVAEPTVENMKSFLRFKQKLISSCPQKFNGERLLLGSNRSVSQPSEQTQSLLQTNSKETPSQPLTQEQSSQSQSGIVIPQGEIHDEPLINMNSANIDKRKRKMEESSRWLRQLKDLADARKPKKKKLLF